MDQISPFVGLEMINISKSFTGVKALDNVSMKVKKGTIHALIGENGAGKSTLMKCLYGMLQQDEGYFVIDGKKEVIGNVEKAIELGISMIHQELFFLPNRTVIENLFLGKTLRKGFFVDERTMEKNAVSLLEKLGFGAIDPHSLAKDLSISELQGLEIAKAVHSNARIIVMDEPTSSLTAHEIEKLFEILRGLREEGKIIIYISHKLEELFQISDEITVLRDGRFISTNETSKITKNDLIVDMVGRELNELFPPKNPKKDFNEETLLTVENFTASNGSFKNVSFDVKQGEILGICGLVGSRRTELVESIYGLREISTGKLTLEGSQVINSNPSEAISNGFAIVTEDRAKNGIVHDLSIVDNLFISTFKHFLKYGVFVDRKKIEIGSNQIIKSLSIRTPSMQTIVKNLSGGNQQKTLIGRWILNSPKIFILDEPTRGVDVGSKYEIYSIMRKLTQTGNSIIMVSSELTEVLGMSDRIVVMCDGEKTAELDANKTNQVEIMKYATQFSREGLI